MMSRKVHAAVVKTLGLPPTYESIDLSEPTGNQIQVEVIASGVHRLVRTIVSGHHYIKPKTLPFVPGVDGVGRLSNGKMVYFLTLNSPIGSMSERVNIDPEMTIALPDGADPIVFAAIMNTGSGSWVALRERAKIQQGETVLILGVTGSTGQMAAVSSQLLGAKQVIGVGRNTSVLKQLLVDGKIHSFIVLDGDEAKFQQEIENNAGDVDIVLDYLWGRPTEIVMTAIKSARKDTTQRLRWVEVGQVAGATIQCSAVLLRSRNIEIIGSGIGCISNKDILKSLEQMVPAVMEGKLSTSVIGIPLKDIEKKWEGIGDITERSVVVM